MKMFVRILLILMIYNIESRAQGYYPLQAGNIWQYRDIYDSTLNFTATTLTDTTMSDGRTYTAIWSRGAYVGDTTYLLQTGNKVYSYSVLLQEQELWYDFSRSVGDTIAVHFPPFDTSYVILIDVRMVNLFGRVRTEWTFYEKWRSSSMYIMRKLVDSIGLSFYQYEPGEVSYGLRGALINGTKYGIITGVKSTNSSTSPMEYKLLQNYPNPFNPQTIITFSLPHTGHVTLDVINVLGEATGTLVDSHVEAGEHKITFNASSLSSGVYFYRLRTSTGIVTKKMIVLK